MAIRVRGNGLQIDVTVTRTGDDGKPSQARHRESFKGTPQEAAAREKDIEAALLRGEDPAEIKKDRGGSGLRLHDALEATYEKYWRSAGVSKTIRSNMKRVEVFFGKDTLISDITTDDADRFVASMKAEGLAASTIRSNCATITRMLRHFHKRGVLKTLPHFDMPAVGDNLRDRIITPVEERVLLDLFALRWDVVTKRRADGTPGEDFHDAFVMLLDTGLRPSELQATETANLRGRLLTLRKTKNGRTRTVPLTQRALEAFTRQTQRHGSKPFEWASTPALRHGWDWARNAMELASDTGFIMYALRHTCATRLYDKTRDLLLVQKWMGHTDIKMTLRYAKLMPGDLEAACDLLEKPAASRPLAA